MTMNPREDGTNRTKTIALNLITRSGKECATSRLGKAMHSRTIVQERAPEQVPTHSFQC